MSYQNVIQPFTAKFCVHNLKDDGEKIQKPVLGYIDNQFLIH